MGEQQGGAAGRPSQEEAGDLQRRATLSMRRERPRAPGLVSGGRGKEEEPGKRQGSQGDLGRSGTNVSGGPQLRVPAASSGGPGGPRQSPGQGVCGAETQASANRFRKQVSLQRVAQTSSSNPFDVILRS